MDSGERSKRFEALRGHPMTAELLEREPTVPPAFRMSVVGVAAITIIMLGLAWVTVFAFESGDPLLMLAGGLSALAFLVLAIWFFQQRRQSKDSALIRRICRVARTEQLGMDSRRRTLLLEEQDGSRTTFEALHRTVAHVAVDDFGVAYTQGSRLLDFSRVDV